MKDDTIRPQTYHMEEVAQILGVCRAQVYNNPQDVGAIRIGKRWIVPRARLAKILCCREEDLPEPGTLRP